MFQPDPSYLFDPLKYLFITCFIGIVFTFGPLPSIGLSFLKNLGTISKDVIYNGDKTNLFADKIEMNLSTKDTKIFMNNANDEVLIESTN